MQNGHANASETVSCCLKPPIQHVLIVGAGIAGLSAAHALQKQGIAFNIIDAQADVGGVWASGYEGLKAQGAGSLFVCMLPVGKTVLDRIDSQRNASLGSLIQCMPHVPTALARMLHVTSGPGMRRLEAIKRSSTSSIVCSDTLVLADRSLVHDGASRVWHA